MLEIVEKTLNGVTQKPQEYSFSSIKFSVAGFPAIDGSSGRTDTITVPLSKTIAKPKYVIYNVNGFASTGSNSNGDGGTAIISSFNSDGISDGFAGYGSDDYAIYSTCNYLTNLNTTGDNILSIGSTYHNVGSNGDGWVQSKIAFNDYSLYNDNLTIRYKTDRNGNSISTDIPNPENDFDSYGTEFSSTEYDSVNSWNTDSVTKYIYGNDSPSIHAMQTFSGRITGVTSNSSAIIVFTNISSYNQNDNHDVYCGLSILLWNYTTSTWDNMGATTNGYNYSNAPRYLMQSNGGTSKVIISPSGTEKWSDGKYSDYIKNGVIYFGAQSSSSSNESNSTSGIKLSYAGIGYINGTIWS